MTRGRVSRMFPGHTGHPLTQPEPLMPRRAVLAVLAAALSGVVALPVAPANACMGPVCDAINYVCQNVPPKGGSQCVG